MPGDEYDECEHEDEDYYDDRLHPEKPFRRAAFHEVSGQAQVFVTNDDGAVFLSCAALTGSLTAMILLGTFLFFERRELRGQLGCVTLLALYSMLKQV